ncbi:MAG: hypothetical protein IPO21_12335 [Bacteroidales bacterium]|nr:hypothetical protein [Bacteroidales bacterium]
MKKNYLFIMIIGLVTLSCTKDPIPSILPIDLEVEENQSIASADTSVCYYYYNEEMVEQYEAISVSRLKSGNNVKMITVISDKFPNSVYCFDDYEKLSKWSKIIFNVDIADQSKKLDEFSKYYKDNNMVACEESGDFPDEFFEKKEQIMGIKRNTLKASFWKTIYINIDRKGLNKSSGAGVPIGDFRELNNQASSIAQFGGPVWYCDYKYFEGDRLYVWGIPFQMVNDLRKPGFNDRIESMFDAF